MAYQLCRLFNAKDTLVEQNLNYSWGGEKEVFIFPKGISPKVNVLVLLEFELTYFEAGVLYFFLYN